MNLASGKVSQGQFSSILNWSLDEQLVGERRRVIRYVLTGAKRGKRVSRGWGGGGKEKGGGEVHCLSYLFSPCLDVAGLY
jgi:hypothetical protein